MGTCPCTLQKEEKEEKEEMAYSVVSSLAGRQASLAMDNGSRLVVILLMVMVVVMVMTMSSFHVHERSPIETALGMTTKRSQAQEKVERNHP